MLITWHLTPPPGQDCCLCLTEVSPAESQLLTGEFWLEPEAVCRRACQGRAAIHMTDDDLVHTVWGFEI